MTPQLIDGPHKINGRTKMRYRCECGEMFFAGADKVARGHTRSCGCLQRAIIRARQTRHSHYYEPEYTVWANMIKRCSSPFFAKWYGKIKVCDEWKLSYDVFRRDVGPKPSPVHTLDRIDPNGDYAPSNVRWATRTVQSRNTKLHDTNKTGARGVSWSKTKKRWRAAIYVNNKQTHLGYFVDFAAAVDARKTAELRLWGELRDG